jgi:hypothetical protein
VKKVFFRFTSYLVFSVTLGCGGPGRDRSVSPEPGEHPSGACPAEQSAPARLPSVRPEQLEARYWLEPAAVGVSPGKILLSVEQIARYNEAVGRRGGGELYSQHDLLAQVDAVRLEEELRERLEHMRERLASARLVDGEGRKLDEARLEAFSTEPLASAFEAELKIVLKPVQIRCGPFDDSLYEAQKPRFYDRNACSMAREQEVLQVIARWPSDLLLVRTRYALGWIASDAPLSASIPPSSRETFVRGERFRAASSLQLTAGNGAILQLPRFGTLPAVSRKGPLLFASKRGFHRARIPAGMRSTRRALTRRDLMETAFEYLGTAYGYGDAGGGRDCSRLLLDLFESFDIALPRHSGWQARAGSFAVDVEPIEDEAERLRLLDLSARRGAVLLYFPGHIMLYLGRSKEGVPMALHALGEYVRPCPGGSGETLVRVNRVVVSDLELGRGTSRRSFLQRLTRLVVLGGEPGPELETVAERRAAPPQLPSKEDGCQDSLDLRIFTSPRRPETGGFLRVIATGARDPGPAALRLFDPSGKTAPAAERKLGGPPFTTWTRVSRPMKGVWTAVLGNGDRLQACKRIRVREGPMADSREADEDKGQPSGNPVWQNRWAWERDTENLWSAFVEQLFDYPADDERTWTNLHDVLRDPERNLLHGHLGLDEENRIELSPDCADLPYSLRAYFAWKLRLPFAFRRCSRGRKNRPPTCGDLNSNLDRARKPGDIPAFSYFAARTVASGVHSSSGRTHPEDENTDLYPVGLDRASLAPGTVFADPYGHVMVVTRWYPQPVDQQQGYGILMAAEAQPDGTVGRRRFWRGSFLFDPSTRDVGAGFKHFRPLIYDRRTGGLTALGNRELENHPEFAPFSLQQYQGSKEDFYDRMEAIINPRPLDPFLRMVSLVDALQETVNRRVIAVGNGVRFVAENGFAPVEMPQGYAIFETTGPWEDYSTPSRDMRLLISIDTVVGFPDKVSKRPRAFGLEEGRTAKATAALRERLAQELGSRFLTYIRSDGSEQKLSLQQVCDRAEALEIGYHPNDCIEVRWGAPEGSEERATCQRRAKAEDRARMEHYRPWFRTPPRPPPRTR